MAGEYHQNLVDFYAASLTHERVGALGTTPSGQLTFFAHIRNDLIGAAARILDYGDGVGGSAYYVRITYIATGASIRIQIKNSSNVVVCQVTSINSFAQGELLAILFSCDLRGGAGSLDAHLYINGSNEKNLTTFNQGNDVPWGTVGKALLWKTHATGDQKLDGNAADLWLNDSYHDFSLQSERDKFIEPDGTTPKYLGHNGELPEGSTPLVFFGSDMLAADWDAGRGTDDFSLTAGAYSDLGSPAPDIGSTAATAKTFAPAGLIVIGEAERWGIWIYNAAGDLVFSVDGLGVDVLVADNFVINAVHLVQSSETFIVDGTPVDTNREAAIIQSTTLSGRPISVLGWVHWNATANDDQEVTVYYKPQGGAWTNLGVRISATGAAGIAVSIPVMAQLSDHVPGDYEFAIAYDTAPVGIVERSYIQTMEGRDAVGLLEKSTVTAVTSLDDELKDSAPGWTVDEHHNRYCRLRPGDIDEEQQLIFNNTASVLKMKNDWAQKPQVGDIYNINSGPV